MAIALVWYISTEDPSDSFFTVPDLGDDGEEVTLIANQDPHQLHIQFMLPPLYDAIDEIVSPLYPGYRRTFSISDVTGTWKPLKGSHPYKGRPGRIVTAEEKKIEFIAREMDLKPVLMRIREIHPYEEPMIDVSPTYAWKSML